MSLANNHAFDCGIRGFEQTKTALAEADVLCFGAGLNRSGAAAPAVLDVDGFKVGIIGFSFTLPVAQDVPGVAYLYDDTLDMAVDKARDEVDLFGGNAPFWSRII